ncbi:MAG: IS4 family transposase [Spirulina sp. SIO3F2]|nr:IS4 family transposase [Spirulina sp. SIO3F2]
MPRQRPRKTGNPDLRSRSQVPTPENAELEAKLVQWLQPQNFMPLKEKQGRSEEKLRSRILTLPVMVAIVVGLVYRKIPSLAEVIRQLELHGLLWLDPTKVSVSALSKRLRKVPAKLFVELWETVRERMEQEPVEQVLSKDWQGLREKFRVIWIADGSTLEELRKRLKIRCAAVESKLGGRMMMIVELVTLRPVQMQYEINPHSNDKIHCDWLLSQLPKGGLMVFDLGFVKFPFFDAFTDSQRFFVTRLREKTAYTTQRVLAQGQRYRDEIIDMGQYRSNPCHHPVRLVSVQWNQTWYHYLTNVLDPTLLSAPQVCDLYRRRWRIEDAFSLTKRLLGLAYLWVEDSNGVEIQIVATWIFYAVLNDLCAQMSVALRQPLETISFEMVFRGLYHYAQARLKDSSVQLIPFFTQHAKLLGLLKARRKRHRLRDAQWAEIWQELQGANPCYSFV